MGLPSRSLANQKAISVPNDGGQDFRRFRGKADDLSVAIPGIEAGLFLELDKARRSPRMVGKPGISTIRQDLVPAFGNRVPGPAVERHGISRWPTGIEIAFTLLVRRETGGSMEDGMTGRFVFVIGRLPLSLALLIGFGMISGLAFFYGANPVLAWFPGENRLGNTLSRGFSVGSGVRLIAVHRANAVVLQDDDYLFPLKLLLQGGIPLPAPAGAICRPGDA